MCSVVHNFASDLGDIYDLSSATKINFYNHILPQSLYISKQAAGSPSSSGVFFKFRASVAYLYST